MMQQSEKKMKIIKVNRADESIPGWVAKTLKGVKKTSPYIFKAITPDALDNLSDLAAWCQKNGSPQSKVINTSKGRFIKIVDPLCRELELKNLVKDSMEENKSFGSVVVAKSRDFWEIASVTQPNVYFGKDMNRLKAYLKEVKKQASDLEKAIEFITKENKK